MNGTIEAMLRRDMLFLLLELRIFWIAILLQTLSVFFYLLWLHVPLEIRGRAASRLLTGSALILSAILILRTLQAGRPPCQSLYDSLLWFSWSAMLAYLVVERRFGSIFAAGFPVALIATVSCLYAVLRRNPSIEPVLPAFQSQWFTWHVISAFISYAVLVVAFAVEISYMALTEFVPPERYTEYGMDAEVLARFHRGAHQLVLFGFPLLTVGIVSGAAWADQAWGRYWSWTPKETWSLITWAVYTLYLHAMTMQRWRGRRGSALNILGFVCVVMTFVGVNWIAELLGIPSL